MISIPIWVFVLLIVLASITAILLLLVMCAVLATLIGAKDYESESVSPYCPDKIDPDNPDYNPEYIPKVEREE